MTAPTFCFLILNLQPLNPHLYSKNAWGFFGITPYVIVSHSPSLMQFADSIQKERQSDSFRPVLLERNEADSLQIFDQSSQERGNQCRYWTIVSFRAYQSWSCNGLFFFPLSSLLQVHESIVRQIHHHRLLMEWIQDWNSSVFCRWTPQVLINSCLPG